MIRTTNFIVVKTEDLKQNMPSHFTPKYGYLNPETERMNMRSWGELITDPNYMLGHGGTWDLLIDKVPCKLISLNLSAINGDYEYEAAYKYGIDLIAPFGTVVNWQEAEGLIEQYKIIEE
jgi:hypothetical protein